MVEWPRSGEGPLEPEGPVFLAGPHPLLGTGGELGLNRVGIFQVSRWRKEPGIEGEHGSVIIMKTRVLSWRKGK